MIPFRLRKLVDYAAVGGGCCRGGLPVARGSSGSKQLSVG